MPPAERSLPHLYLRGGAESEQYTSRQRGRTPAPPQRDRAAHAQALLNALNIALTKVQQHVDHQAAAGLAETGFYLDFQLPPGAEQFIDKLEDRRRHIELVAAKASESAISATVWVPQSAAQHFATKIQAYRDQLGKGGKPKNEALVSRIDAVAAAALRSVFTDDDQLFPATDDPAWWEVWVRHGRADEFKHAATEADLTVSTQVIRFAERDVVLVLATPTALGRLMVNSTAIAEVRMATDNPANFVELQNTEQREWAEEMADRLQAPPQGAPAVCLLDSGVTREHPLLEPVLAAADVHRYDVNWPAGDSDFWRGHGTKMAGLAAHGDLFVPLASTEPLQATHVLEVVTILEPNGDQHDPKLYGAVTVEAVSRAAVQAPERRRVVCMAVTSDVDTRRGRPSSWSAAIDGLAFGEGLNQQLILVSAGNIRDNLNSNEYLARNDAEPIENPAQAWNAISVGGYTEKVNISNPQLAGWNPIAPAGGISPTSRTSVSWDRQWPTKPEVLVEAGNVASDGQICSEVDDLCLLSTHHRPNIRHFTTFSETSAATALAANLAARIWAARPELWPESIRGLIVHSAEWTPVMRGLFDAAPRKIDRLPLLRRYGYGVPSLERALFSATNDMTLIVESEILPFWRDPESSRIKTRHLNLHRLPWPVAELQALGDQQVELRVTLSYFVEPNPGERGWTRRHRYASHGLRFALRRSTETVDEFRARINRAVQVEDSGSEPVDGTDDWYLGSIRDTGSLHSDVWIGTAAALAARDALAVFPVSGWWKEKPDLERLDRTARYSLIVSIRAAATETDIYTPVLTAIQNVVPIAT